MFEHLGPAPEVKIKRKASNFKLYLPLFLVALFVFLLALSVGQGPSSFAYPEEVAQVKIAVNSQPKKIINKASNFSIFDFVLDADREGVSIYKLSIATEGLYDVGLLNDIKLFHEDVQLGEVKTIDQLGNIYFELADYKLHSGQNLFSLYVPSAKSIDLDTKVAFSIKDRDDIYLMYQGHIFGPQGTFPLQGGLGVVVDKGSLVATNDYLIKDFLINSNLPQKIASFSLSAKDEIVDLYGISFHYQTANDIDALSEFVLIKDGVMLAQAKSDEDHNINFDLVNPQALKSGKKISYELHALGLPNGQYDFYLKDVVAKGSISGLYLDDQEDLFLSHLDARDYFVEFSGNQLDTVLSTGWNKIYSLNIKARGMDSFNLHKMTWQIASHNIDIGEAEILLNDQPYIADILVKDDKIIVKTDGFDPLLVTEQGIRLDLLLDVKTVKEKAKIEAIFLNDKELIDDELEGNIIWSYDGEFMNSYKMPYFPLPVSILSN